MGWLWLLVLLFVNYALSFYLLRMMTKEYPEMRQWFWVKVIKWLGFVAAVVMGTVMVVYAIVMGMIEDHRWSKETGGSDD